MTTATTEAAAERAAAALLPIPVADGATDAEIDALAASALDYFGALDEEYDGHAEDMEEPDHDSDYDPCGVCNPYDRDLAVAALARALRKERDESAQSAA